MKTTFRAFFIHDGNSIISLVSNRVEKHALVPKGNSELSPRKTWTAKIKNCLYVVEAPKAERLIATDTSGRHFGLCCETGDILWQSDALGEGDAGLVVASLEKSRCSQEVFVFATWSGVLHQLDPANGKHLVEPADFLSQFRDMRLISSSQSVYVTTIVPAKSDIDPVGEKLNEINLRTNKLTEVLRNTFSHGIKVSPNGDRALYFYIDDDSTRLEADCVERWEVKNIKSGSTICRRTFVDSATRRPPDDGRNAKPAP